MMAQIINNRKESERWKMCKKANVDEFNHQEGEEISIEGSLIIRHIDLIELIVAESRWSQFAKKNFRQLQLA